VLVKAAVPMIKVLGLSLYGSQAASTRYRLTQYRPSLREHGIDLDVKALLDNDYIQKSFAGEKYPRWDLFRRYLKRAALLFHQKQYDMAILHVELFPLLPGLLESSLLRIPYIYDFDDAFFLKYKGGRFRLISRLLKDKFDPVVSSAAAVTAGNRYLLDYARLWNSNACLLPTVIDTDLYTYAPNKRDGVFTIGWNGSPSTSVYLPELVQPLAELGREGPVRFVVVAGKCPPIEGVDVVHLPWNEATEVGIVNTYDVGVMPLFDDEWAKGKCALKLLQYMACGVPVVASPVGANLDVVDGACGFFADNKEAWLDSLRRLRDDLPLRRSMGERGRTRVENLYSLRSASPTMVSTINLVAAKG
jgi:glycosyltransferase involved in cell wall biosynthesis